MPRTSSLTLLLCLSASLRFLAPAAAQAPAISAVVPGGGPRGGVTTVEIEGKNLAGARLHFHGRGLSVKELKVSPGGDRVTAEIAAEKDAWLGPQELRVTSPRGISNGWRFFVDTLPNAIQTPMQESDP